MTAQVGPRREFDVLVIGSGIAGLAAALAAAGEGRSVAVVSKEGELSECNTNYAQGGIVYRGEGGIELLERDIVSAGCAINFGEAVRVVCEEGPRAIEDILIRKSRVLFDPDGAGGLDLTQEAAHSTRRIIHVKDHTGAAIEKGLLGQAGHVDRIAFFTGHCAVDLITNSHHARLPEERYRPTRVIGAYVFDERREEVSIFFAPRVVLATGGVGNLFLHTSNTPGASGDGIAMANRSGAEIINAEYVQFHPTILYHRDVKRFLISEALRGEGARLMNRRGEYFLEKYNPAMKDLAPRDEVARAIFYEMEATDAGYVFLDARQVSRVDLKTRFPSIARQCREIGIDIAREPIPVVPAAHYFCGGIKVDLSGRTNIPGLYAVGESACTGVHGANRLASVSLLEGLVWGTRAGRDAALSGPAGDDAVRTDIPDWISPRPEEEIDPVLVYQDLHNIRSTMWNYAGIVRNRKRLARALSDFNYLSHRVEKFYRQARLTRTIIELRNAVLTASLIIRAAQANRDSLGCHFVEKG
ncbi:MAG: L-aspartate oxidase [Spirochaetales bacterium]|nr:L-aspartate oxidase [Spirochaetales bacterium]